jgi:type IV pilus modification protein PilV
MKYRCHGMALLEVMIATVWVSLTIAGLWSWQARASALDEQARQRLQAANLITQLSERLHALRAHSSTAEQITPSAWAWAWGSPVAAEPTDCWHSACTAAAWQVASLSAWRHAVRDTLPQGDSRVQPLAADHAVRVTLRWRRPSAVAGEPSTTEATDCPLGWACLEQTLLF